MSFEKYKQIFHEFAEEVEFMDENIKKLNLDENSKILDIGTGMGAMSTLLAFNGFNVLTGEPELDPESAAQINNHHHHQVKPHDSNQYEPHEEHDWGAWNDWKDSAKRLGVEGNIKFQNFDAQDLPFEENSFDGIFMYDALQHIQNRELALNECLRVLNNEGVIVVIEWTKKQIEKEYMKYGYKIDFIDPRDYLKQDDVSTEILRGEVINFYILRKN
jgi:2-polyprenyl-3-methyl-5-hydroxy-6-metoxy-1,4-benzoquinol methylase